MRRRVVVIGIILSLLGCGLAASHWYAYTSGRVVEMRRNLALQVPVDARRLIDEFKAGVAEEADLRRIDLQLGACDSWLHGLVIPHMNDQGDADRVERLAQLLVEVRDIRGQIRSALSGDEVTRAVAPQVLSIVPADEARNVRPGDAELKVVFDRDMQAGFSWCGDPEAFPRSTGNARWIDRRTCVLPIKLDPDREYTVGINAPSYRNFRSTAGVPVEPRSIRFRTAKG